MLKEQKRLERQREIEEKRRSLAVCTGLDLGHSLGREPHGQENQDELEKLLEKNLSYTWSRRSLRSSDSRRYSHQLHSDTHLHNTVLKIFPELGSSPTSTGCHSNSSSDQETTAELRVSSPDTDGTCSPTEQESSVGRRGLCQYGRAANRTTDVAQGSYISASCRGQDFTVKRHGPDRVSYVLQGHQSIGLKEEPENPRGHIVLSHQPLPTSCTNSATLPTETPSKGKGQASACGQSFGLMAMDKSLAAERKADDANFESVHRSPHSGGIRTIVDPKAELARYPSSESQMRSISDAPERAQNRHRRVGVTTRIPSGAMPDASLRMHTDTEEAAAAVTESWLPSGLPDFIESQPEVLADMPSPEPEMERSYSRVGETVECHTLVKGLRSYDTLSPPTSPLPRPAPSLCSKWRKEREGDLREGTTPGSPASKEEARSVKNPARSGIGGRRGLLSHAGPSNSPGILRARSKNEPSNGIQTSSPGRLASPRSAAARSSAVARAAAAQSEVKCGNGAPERSASESQTAGKPTLNRRTSDRSLPEKSSGGNQQSFVRGSLFRVSKRLAPNSESQVTPQPRSSHSPSSATAKTIRTTVISAARNKTAKTTGSGASPVGSKSAGVSRIPGPKMPRATGAQPLWR